MNHVSKGLLVAAGCIGAGLTLAVLSLPESKASVEAEATPTKKQGSGGRELPAVSVANSTASNTSADEAGGIQVALNSNWISGAWLRDGDGACEGDSGETFLPDGTWGDWGEEGSWQISRNELRIAVTHYSGHDTESGEREPLPAARVTRGFVVAADQDTFTWLTTANKEIKFHRCVNDES